MEMLCTCGHGRLGSVSGMVQWMVASCGGLVAPASIGAEVEPCVARDSGCAIGTGQGLGDLGAGLAGSLANPWVHGSSGMVHEEVELDDAESLALV